MMDDKPGLEETKKDIEITKKELEAYRKLQQGYNILTYDIPDQLPINRLEYGMKADKFFHLANRCESFLNELIEYKNKLEGESENCK